MKAHTVRRGPTAAVYYTKTASAGVQTDTAQARASTCWVQPKAPQPPALAPTTFNRHRTDPTPAWIGGIITTTTSTTHKLARSSWPKGLCCPTCLTEAAMRHNHNTGNCCDTARAQQLMPVKVCMLRKSRSSTPYKKRHTHMHGSQCLHGFKACRHRQLAAGQLPSEDDGAFFD